MDAPPLPRRRWTREEYGRMLDAGILQPDERVELLDGEVVPMTPQKSLHAATVQALSSILMHAVAAGFQVRVQLPLALGRHSEPEPDIAVVRGERWDFRSEHPDTAALVAEVADTSLGRDRLRKGPLYARAGIPEYWILDLTSDTLEVCRDPGEDGYASVSQLRRGQTVRLLADPNVTLAVDDLLPPL
jgi:Uma2 family endonuclease